MRPRVRRRPVISFQLLNKTIKMRNYSNDYLSEFEREFEMEFETDTLNHENEFEFENLQEFENEDEFENVHEFENEDEFEFQDENSYESRLYEALNSNYESELEFENSLNEVLHEMEKDYFWGSLKKWVKKKGGIKGLLAKYGKKLPIVSAANALSSVARGDLRGAVKSIAGNGLLKTGLSMIPGGGVAARGLDMANKLLGDSETPKVSMDNVKQAVAVGKDAYDNLARQLASAQSPQDLVNMGKKALQQAIQGNKPSAASSGMQQSGKKSGSRTRIPYPKGSVVSVHADYISIWKPSSQ